MLTSTGVRRAIPAPPLPTVVRIDRRRRDANAARFAQRVTEHARWLPPEEAALVRGVYQAGQTAGQRAAIAQVPKRIIQRRIRKVLERTLTPDFRFAARQLELAHDTPAWPPTPGALRGACERLIHLAVLRAVFIEGLSLREAAERLGITRHAARRHHEMARLEMEAKTE